MKKIICLDAEFANQEILELAIFADTLSGEFEPKEVFHSLFKPENERRWPGSERIHHISPAMVRRAPFFRRCRNEIQQLIDDADCLVGFAIENDIEALRREGIVIPEEKQVIDVRDLHWIMEGRAKGIELDSRKGLAVTAGELDVEFNENEAHGATYDTVKTLECFRKLFTRFACEIVGCSGKEWPEDIIFRYLSHWTEMREEYLKDFARGWISLVETREGFRLKASRISAPEEGKDYASIQVKARWRALNEIDAQFARRRHPDHPSIYLLKQADIDWFRTYQNEYDGDEQLHHRLYDLRRRPNNL